MGHVERGEVLVLEKRIGGRIACLAPDPCLDGIETLGSLMDIVEIGDVAEGTEKLNQAFGPISNDAPRHRIPIEPIRRATARQGDISIHTNPRSPNRLLPEPLQPYAIDNDPQTTNMRLNRQNHNIFTPFSVKE